MTPENRRNIEEFIAAATRGNPDMARVLTSFLNSGSGNDEPPPAGTRVTSLRSGFGTAHPGARLTVVAVGRKGEPASGNSTWGDDYLVLTDGKRRFLSRLDSWWHDVCVETLP